MAREKRITIRYFDEECEKVKQKSLSTYMVISDYVRTASLQKEIIIIDGLVDFTIQLRRIGTNLNQLTRLCNEGRLSCLELGGG